MSENKTDSIDMKLSIVQIEGINGLFDTTAVGYIEEARELIKKLEADLLKMSKVVSSDIFTVRVRKSGMFVNITCSECDTENGHTDTCNIGDAVEMAENIVKEKLC